MGFSKSQLDGHWIKTSEQTHVLSRGMRKENSVCELSTEVNSSTGASQIIHIF